MTEQAERKDILENLATPPKAGKAQLYRWCDYIELRCLTHIDKRFSRDALLEAMSETKDLTVNENNDTEVEILETIDLDNLIELDGLEEPAEIEDKNSAFVVTCFNHLRWRQEAFGSSWPFTLDEHAKEIVFIKPLNPEHLLYLQLLLSSSLSYCPQSRYKDLTSKFEQISFKIFKCLMPNGSEVHAFGAAESKKYKGHLFDRLVELAKDVRGKLVIELHHFAKNDAGDGGLDLVSWHPLGDERGGVPIAFAQCGCTADGWPNKMLEASPSKMGSYLHTMHEWSTYYFMPLDLSNKVDQKMDWQFLSDFGKAIVVDRLRFLKLATAFSLFGNGMYDVLTVTEATSLRLT